MSRKYSTKSPKFFFLDGKIALPLILVLLNPSWTLLWMLLGMSIALWILKNKGMDLSMLSRRIRCFFAGNRREIRSRFRQFI